MAYYTYEGTKDFIVVQPALVLSFVASGSITAGRIVAFDAGGTSEVYVPSAVAGGALPCVGVALNTASDNSPVSVLVWGFAKNLVMANADETFRVGELVTISGSGYFTSGSAYCIGRTVSGSASSFMALIDCLKVLTVD
jgi:hypothetical protein